jgi:hypothetical protein
LYVMVPNLGRLLCLVANYRLAWHWWFVLACWYLNSLLYQV